MSKEEIALQLTLKAMDKFVTPRSSEANTSADSNFKYSDSIVKCYNNILNNIVENNIEPIQETI